MLSSDMPESRDPSDKTLHKIEAKTVQPRRHTLLERLLSPFKELFGLSHVAAVLSLIGTAAILALAVYWFFRLAPPHTLVMSSGAEGSSFQTNALKYRAILAREGVDLQILPSQGSLENLRRLYNPTTHVDIAFVQGGISNAPQSKEVLSLGSVSYEPLLVFYRTNITANLLSDFKGKRLAIGPQGSGTRALALALLQLNGITNDGPTILLDLDADKAAAQLLAGTVDAIFLTADSAGPPLMRKLLLDPQIQMLDFIQADAYTRRVNYLNKLLLPKGSLDFGRNIPRRDVYVIGPTVELLAREDLHPALCDLLLDAAKEIHGRATLLQHKNEFPAPIEHEFPISPEAVRYYKSGKSFFYRHLPFWLGSLLNRVLLVFVPVVVVMIPGLRMLPVLFSWKTKLRFLKWYRALLLLEHDLRGAMDEPKRTGLVSRLDEIEQAVNRMKVPASFAEQFYSLREHIAFVRARLAGR
jgi:TRAP-type uncharacterized transport system substrate-binding protein